jgi:hypothetical protein
MDSQDLDGDGFGDNLQRTTFDESFNCDPFEDVTPQWSPNSSLIAFTSVRSGYFDIWVVNADDPTDLRNVTKTPLVAEDQPNWSPDGTQIIYRIGYDLYSLPVPPPGARHGVTASARPQPKQLTFDGQPKREPDWGPVPGSVPGTVALTVAKKGRGVVSSAPAGIACGRDCLSTFVALSIVKLTATPVAGYRFGGWSGACTGEKATCRVKMKASRTVFARFVRQA